MTEKEKEAYKQLVRSQLYLSLDTDIRLALTEDILNEVVLETIKVCDRISDIEATLLENQ